VSDDMAALRNLFRHGDMSRLEVTEKKSLTSFSFGSSGFIMPPEMSSTVLSCLVDPTDVTGLMNNVTISAPSIKFLIDNARMQDSAWACETACFANNPQADLTEGLGDFEIKAETSRHVVCAGSDLLQDSSFNIEQWVLRKVVSATRSTTRSSLATGSASHWEFSNRFGVHLLEPSHPQQMGKPTRILAVRLHGHRRQCRLHVPRLQQNGFKSRLRQPGMQPL